MGISFNYCQAIPDVYYNDAEVCATIQDNPVQIGSRECSFFETSELYSVDATLASENLGPYEFSIGFWVGAEVDPSTGEVCVWMGNEDAGICNWTCNYPDQIAIVDDIYPLVEDTLNEIADEYNIGLWDIIGAIAVLVVVALLAYLFGPVALGGVAFA